jgi:hypothetical protein
MNSLRVRLANLEVGADLGDVGRDKDFTTQFPTCQPGADGLRSRASKQDIPLDHTLLYLVVS